MNGKMYNETWFFFATTCTFFFCLLHGIGMIRNKYYNSGYGANLDFSFEYYTRFTCMLYTCTQGCYVESVVQSCALYYVLPIIILVHYCRRSGNI